MSLNNNNIVKKSTSYQLFAKVGLTEEQRKAIFYNDNEKDLAKVLSALREAVEARDDKTFKKLFAAEFLDDNDRLWIIQSNNYSLVYEVYEACELIKYYQDNFDESIFIMMMNLPSLEQHHKIEILSQNNWNIFESDTTKKLFNLLLDLVLSIGEEQLINLICKKPSTLIKSVYVKRFEVIENFVDTKLIDNAKKKEVLSYKDYQIFRYTASNGHFHTVDRLMELSLTFNEDERSQIINSNVTEINRLIEVQSDSSNNRKISNCLRIFFTYGGDASYLRESDIIAKLRPSNSSIHLSALLHACVPGGLELAITTNNRNLIRLTSLAIKLKDNGIEPDQIIIALENCHHFTARQLSNGVISNELAPDIATSMEANGLTARTIEIFTEIVKKSFVARLEARPMVAGGVSI